MQNVGARRAVPSRDGPLGRLSKNNIRNADEKMKYPTSNKEFPIMK
jgi:hypothetical protein